MTTQHTEHTLVIDIGKTHVKLHVLDDDLASAYSRQMTNKVNYDSVFPSANTTQIWDWFCETIKELTPDFKIKKVTITTHGATAALIDRNRSGDGLVLPVLDYEYEGTFSQSSHYENVRPAFTDTFSPSLPAGLNLGRQLFWLKSNYPSEFSSASDILMYPQYWAWRFTGSLVSEVTSLGCHTDLWSVKDEDYSSLVDALDARNLFPPLEDAWHKCGNIKESLCDELGLPEGCEFHSGLHDSNASFLRYRLAQADKPFTVISTGTWTILMASQVSLAKLNPERDMLANVDALGTPIACARFMGGREFETICEQAGSWLGEQFTEEHLQEIIDKEVFALPDFSAGSGPFGGRKAGFVGTVDKVSGIALATLYSALMIDYQLSSLDAQGDVIVEGAFLKNPILCSVINQLRTSQDVTLSMDSTGTVVGAAYLTKWGKVESNIELKPADMARLKGIEEYRDKWLKLVL